MSHTYTNLLTHVIFSTKDRAPLITAPLIDDLLAYLGGIVREIGGTLRAANASPDHVHLLWSMPPMMGSSIGNPCGFGGFQRVSDVDLQNDRELGGKLTQDGWRIKRDLPASYTGFCSSKTSRTLRAREDGVKGFWIKAAPDSSTPLRKTESSVYPDM
jgi:hypothetical protein